MKEHSGSPRMERLRSLLRGPPGQEAFRDVFDLIAGSPRCSDLPPWHDERERDDAIGEAERALGSWDDAVRDYPLQSRHFVDRDHVKPWGRLVRRVTIYRQEDGGDRDLATIAASPFMRDLHQIVVTRSGCDVLRTFRGPTEVGALRVLELRDAYVAEETWKLLAAAPQLATLERLELAGFHVLPAHLARWLEGTPGRSLRELALRDLAGGPRLLHEALLPRARLLEQLAALTLSACFLDDASALELARAGALDKLDTLDLRKNDRISANARRAILEAPQFRATNVLFD